MEWLAVASARTPSVAATTFADATSHTFASTRISGARCRSSSVRARAARSVMRSNLDRSILRFACEQHPRRACMRGMRTCEVSTPDGRVLEVVEDGDPAGVPLVVHHGTPGAAGLHPDWVADARQRGLRLVSYSRP